MATKLFDVDEALKRIDNDLELYFELIEIFFEEYDSSISAITQSIEQTDGNALERSAHSIKGALGNIGASSSFEIAYSLENMGRKDQLEGASDELEKLISEISKFRQKVEEFRTSKR